MLLLLCSSPGTGAVHPGAVEKKPSPGAVIWKLEVDSQLSRMLEAWSISEFFGLLALGIHTTPVACRRRVHQDLSRAAAVRSLLSTRLFLGPQSREQIQTVTGSHLMKLDKEIVSEVRVGLGKRGWMERPGKQRFFFISRAA